MMSRKILLLGEMGVGKTSIARRLKFNTFGDRYKATIGADIYAYDVLPAPLGIEFEFLIWDTDGSYGEGVFRQYYAQQAEAAMIVADACAALDHRHHDRARPACSPTSCPADTSRTS